MTVLIGISVSALILAVFVKDYNKTVSTLIMIAASVLIFFQIAGSLSDVFKTVESVSSSVESSSEYIKLMMKVLGITLITQFVSDLCRDCGESALASQTETAAKIIVIVIILPLFESIVKIISGLIQ